MEQTIKVKRLLSGAKMPTRASDQAAGHDLYACLTTDKIEIYPHQTVKIGTGLAIQLPKNCFGGVFARSGLATKQGLRPANCVGVIDSDYRGECIVPLYDDSDMIQIITNGERIAQLVVLPYLPVDFEETNQLEETDRGQNGFGSTGKN